jgi:hypothetical protein
MKVILSLVLIFFSINIKGFAQSDLCKDIQNEKTGTVTLHADPKLAELIYSNKKETEKEPEMAGFRLQVYNGTDRNEANKVKTELLLLYPEQDVYLKYEQPRFKVRIGNFRNRIEVQKLYHDLKVAYEGVFIVPDKIDFPKFSTQF